MSEPTTLEHEMLQIARRLLEVYELDSVVVLASKQITTEKGYSTDASHANAGKHLARRYAES